MLNRRLSFVAALVLALAVALGAFPASVGAAGNAKPAAGLKPAAPYDAPTAILTSQLEANLRARAPASFAGLVSLNDGTIQVYATTNNAALQETIQSTVANARSAQPMRRQPAVRVSIGDKNTLASLEHLRDMITARRADLTARGIELVQWGVDIPNNRTLLGVKGLTPATKGALEREFGPAQVEVTNSAGWSLASRTADWAPWYGGDTLQNRVGGSSVCTSGFSMLSSNVGYASTAGHCGSSSWYNNNNLIGSTSALVWSNNSNGDAQLIGASSVGGWVWTTNTTAVAVRSFSGSGVGDTGICADGSITGERCGSTVNLTNQCLTDGGTGVTTCGLVVAQSPSGQAVQGGDSGGPVYNYRGDGYLNAKGLIWGVNLGNTSQWAYTPIDVVDQDLNAAPLCGC